MGVELTDAIAVSSKNRPTFLIHKKMSYTKMTKAQLIGLIETKDDQIEALKQELKKPTNKNKPSDKFDKDFFKNALAVLQNYDVVDEDGKKASEIVERARLLSKTEVRDDFQESIYYWVAECTDTDDADIDTSMIMDEIFANFLIFGK